MKKSLIALAALMTCAGAKAESSVQLYGVMDVGVGYAKSAWPASSTFPGTFNIWDKTAANAPSQTGLINGGIQHSRWGLKGSEDLGGGLKAFFQLESGFNLPTGEISNGAASLAANAGTTPMTRNTSSGASAISGQLFGRGAFVGLEDATLGRLSVGRQTSIQYDQFGIFDPLGKADAFSPLGFSGTVGGGAGSTDNSRWDQSIKYKNTSGAFNYSLMYKVGADAGSTSSYGGFAGQVGYESGPLGVTFIYTKQKDAIVTDVGASQAVPLAGTLYDLESFVIAGKYKVTDKATVKAGYLHYERQGASTQLATSGSILEVYGYNALVKSYNDTTKKYDLYFVGGDYNFTEKFNVAVGVYNLVNQAYTKQNDTVGSLKGNEWAYSLLADYKFSKRTDVYAGLMYVTFDNGALTTNGTDGGFNKTNYITAVGIRHKF